MTTTFPMTLLAQLGDVTVFQTAAFADSAINCTDADLKNTDVDISASNLQTIGQTAEPSYGALNLGLHVYDDAAKVLDNRMRLLAAINEQLVIQQRAFIHSLHWVNQIHGKQIHDIDVDKLSMHPVAADAIVSQHKAVGLAIMTADCVPIVLYLPGSGRIAAIHAGWQGLACGVIKATVERFTEDAPIMAWIGVCISQDRYEVGREVYDKLLAGCIDNQTLSSANLQHFEHLFSILANTKSDTAITADKVQLNLPKLTAYQLADLGITVCSDTPYHCSYTDKHYYSYRRQTHLQQPATGRMALVIIRSA